MDPTKNFDHLDPKLKETYARVMGTTGGNGDATQNPAGQAAAAPAVFQTPAMAQSQNQFNAAPQDPSVASFQNQNAGPNPGTGPTVNSIPTGTTTMVAPPAQAALAGPIPGMNASATSSFFSNPSPATADPSQLPVPTDTNNNISAPFTPVADPAPAPVTPYTPDNASQTVPSIEVTQPLPSPSSVAQAPKQTSALLRVLYIVAAVVFFAIYTVFWIKVFNLPFLF